ncbi:MAG: peptidylprolyl isomerase [Opitutae bacterium]
MNENKKTITFLAAAIVAVAITTFTSPTKRDPSAKPNLMGQSLFESFDPRSVTGIEIIEVDEEDIQSKSIEVTQTDKGWFIRRPGKADYPANADNQLKDVASILFDLRIIDQAGEGAGEHSKFGVLDPSKADATESGIGRLIHLKNNSGSNLASLIIGEEVEGLSGTYFVRKPEQNAVFRVEVRNARDVSSKFVDWVEKDFLDLDKWKIRQVTLDNYDVNLALGQINRINDPFVLNFADSKWSLAGTPLKENEELDKEVLDALKDALDDLEIIDVERKPDILVKNLEQGSEFFSNLRDANNQAVVQSLQQKGFYTIAAKDAAGQTVPKVVSNKGEVLVGMESGVEYVLRFGEIYRGPEDDENSTGDSRYIYAFAQVNESLLTPPDLEQIPSPEVAKGPEGEKGPIAKPGSPPALTPPTAPPGITPPPPPAEAKVKKVSIANDINSSAQQDAEIAKKKAEKDGEIARINASNARKQKEYNDKVAKARQRASELNRDLAGWYYVISNDVYEKIRLERSSFVKNKDNPEVVLPDEVSASHILISFKGADRADSKITRNKKAAKMEADRIRGLIVDQGKDFAEMAKKHSDGPSGPKGGDLGSFKFEVMAKPFSEAAFALEVNEVSEVVETGFGFHVIKRTK